MIVLIIPYGKQQSAPSKAVCDAHIPLTFIKLSAGAIDVLESIGVKTFEDLFVCEKQTIRDVIVGRGLRKEIFEAKEKIESRAKAKKNLIKFEYFAQNKNIRINKDQRAKLIAVSLFKEIITNLEEVVHLLLETKKCDIPFREQSLRKKLANTCLHAIRKNAA